MAEYSEARPGVRAFILLLLIIVLALGGVIWFDYLGVIDARSVISPVYRVLGLGTRATVANADDPSLLDKERLSKQQDALVIRQQELDSRQAALDAREKQLNQLGQDLNDRQAAIDAQQKALNDAQKAIEDRRVNLDQNATYLTSMTPQKAVDILGKQDDQYVIDTFRTVEAQAKKSGTDSLVPIWLSLMPPDRAATLQRKM
ncbi:MAG TPA: flagellar protein FlbB, partial [Spirochaetia bacterium]|nr:flagellar protein FlbB [Spirochaetia bacterium]